VARTPPFIFFSALRESVKWFGGDGLGLGLKIKIKKYNKK
jgi:hypothetical protein